MVVFDFDKTLTYRDTTLPCLRHGLSLPQYLFCSVGYYALALLVKLGLWTVLRLKQTMFRWRFKGFDEMSWKNHCRDFAATIKTNALYAQVDWTSDNLVVITASFTEAVKHMFPESVLVLGSEIIFSPDVQISRHLYGTEKLSMLKSRGIERIDKFYTDSKADLPLMNIADQVIWVDGDHHQCLPLETINKWNR